jgi:spore coat protein H
MKTLRRVLSLAVRERIPSNEGSRSCVFCSMHVQIRLRRLAHVVGFCVGTLGCGGSDEPPLPTPATPSPEWSEESHGKSAVPDYERLFPADRVLELRLTIAPEDWQGMLDDMTDMAGEFGQGGPDGGGLVLPEAARAACADLREADACSYVDADQGIFEGECRAGPNSEELLCIPSGLADGMLPPPDGGPLPPGLGNEQPIGDDAEFLPRTPIWRPCNVEFEGRAWRMVGVRFKGNSTLLNSWQRGSYKLPLRLRFDKFEDAPGAVADQRFFGFQSLSFTNNSSDPSFAREVLAGELLREAGNPAARTALVRVVVDRGEGATYFGLYTMVEVPDDPLLDSQLGGSGGNLYKPHGSAARFTTFDPKAFEKQSNEKAADYTDVERAIAALNADRSDAAAYRTELERYLDVQGFLRWLATNTIMGNWDVYGEIAHNYYLYGAPADQGRLHWIPWDHDLAFGSGTGPVTSVLHDQVQANWPLIRFLLDDDEYRRDYVAHARAVLDTAFAPGKLEARARELHTLVEPHVLGPAGERPGYTALNDPSELERAFYGDTGLIRSIDALRAAAAAELATEP